MPSTAGTAGKAAGNALVRLRRDLRFVLVDRYRTLLGSRYAAATALVAGAVDIALGIRRTARRTLGERRRTYPTGPRLLRAAVGADGALSVVVTGPAAGGLGLSRGDETEPLATVGDAGDGGVRLVAQLPDEVADGNDRTVTVGGVGIVVTDPGTLPPGCTVRDGRLVLRGRRVPAGVPHTLQIGVRTAVLSWPAAAGDRVVIGDVEVRARVRDEMSTVEFDLADISTTSNAVVVAGGTRAPLTVTAGLWLPAARPVTPRPVRVTPVPGGHTVEIGYTADGHLEFRVATSTAAAWST